MSIEESKSQVRTFISKAKTDEALKIIEAWVNAYGSNEAQIASDLLKAQWADLSRDNRMGFAENVVQRTASINYRILSFNWEEKIEPIIPPIPPKPIPSPNGTRGGLRIPIAPEDLIADTQPMMVKMAINARRFKPFNEVEGQIKILFLAATPMSSGQLNTGKESRFKDIVRFFDKKDRFKVEEEHEFSSNAKELQGLFKTLLTL